MHGKKATFKQAEFWNNRFYCIPERVRAKLDNTHHLEISVGQVASPSGSYVGTLNGRVINTGSIAGVVQSSRRDSKAMLNIKGTPTRLNLGEPHEHNSSILAELEEPHRHTDD